MIFVTVGTQLPFDRLVRAVDEWAAGQNRSDVFAQIGPMAERPRHIQYTEFLDPMDFRTKVADAALVVSHAGMGTILTAMEFCKPIIVMPRRYNLREQRNDHQVATAKHLQAQGQVQVASDQMDLRALLDHFADVPAGTPIRPGASPQLLAALSAFVRGHSPHNYEALRTDIPDRIGHI